MPNLVPPIRTTREALAYRERILAALPPRARFEPLMTLYLTDDTPPEEITAAKESGRVHAVKLYPAGATTHSDAGVTRISRCFRAWRATPTFRTAHATPPSAHAVSFLRAWRTRSATRCTRW